MIIVPDGRIVSRKTFQEMTGFILYCLDKKFTTLKKWFETVKLYFTKPIKTWAVAIRSVQVYLSLEFMSKWGRELDRNSESWENQDEKRRNYVKNTDEER